MQDSEEMKMGPFPLNGSLDVARFVKFCDFGSILQNLFRHKMQAYRIGTPRQLIKTSMNGKGRDESINMVLKSI